MFKRLLHQIGRRGAFLAFLALLDGAYAYGTWITPATPHYSMILTPHQWAACWAVVAAACTVGVFMRRDRVPYSLAAAIKVCWSAVFFRLWLESYPYALINAVFWLVFALIVFMVSSWPDPIYTNAFKGRQDC